MSYNPFQTVLDENHLKAGTKLKKGDEELKVVKPVGDDKYLVKEEELIEKTLTPAELKKREEVAKAMERDKPSMDKSKKMAIATAVAKRVAESVVAREKDGRKFVSAEVAIKLARELAAKRKPGEKATHADLQDAQRRLTREETEQIDELSKDTLSSYYAKSMGDRHSKELARDTAKRKGESVTAHKLGDKVYNRSVGLEKAKAKFTEEVEQIDELDMLGMRGQLSTDPKSKQHLFLKTDAGKAARAKRNVPELKHAIKTALSRHPKATLPEAADDSTK